MSISGQSDSQEWLTMLAVLTPEPQIYLGSKRPLKSSSPTVNGIWPRPQYHSIISGHIGIFPRLQGRGGGNGQPLEDLWTITSLSLMV